MKRVIFLGNENNIFEFELMDALVEECNKYGITIYSNVTIDRNVSIGSNVTIDRNVSIGSNVTIYSNVIIYSFIRLYNMYKYPNGGFISTNKKTSKKIYYIRLGCFTRIREEWEKDFYNNDREFPKGEPQTRLRLKAYKESLRILCPRFKTKVK